MSFSCGLVTCYMCILEIVFSECAPALEGSFCRVVLFVVMSLHNASSVFQRGQDGREKFGFQDRRLNPHSSKTNREKRKTKNYMMLKHKARGKLKRSFKEKQVRPQ
jgi:hypothetical protein